MTCNVCGREIVAGEPFIEGKDCYICTGCSEEIGRIWARSAGIEIWDPEIANEESHLHTPVEIKEYLDKYVIGQDEYKRTIAVAIYNHYKRIMKHSDVPIKKANALVLGNSGSGKTYVVQKISEYLDVPIAICDATTLTEAGYVGDDVESVLVKLYQAADYDVTRAERGIVFIDEIDKIARKGGNPSITRDVSGEGVQQGLLKMIEGNIIGIPPHGGRKHPEQELVYIDTKNILFICAGAFEGIEQRIGQRLNQHSIGYTTDKKHYTDDELLSKVTPSDLRAFGLIPEIIGRLPVITHTNKLSESDLIHILRDTDECLVKQYEALLKMDDCQVTFDDDALEEIAHYAVKAGTGARGLQHIMEKVMNDELYEIPSSGIKETIISLDKVKERLKDE